MKPINLFIATLVLTCFAMFPAAVRADDEMDDLDVTVDILDSTTDVDEAMSEMRGPDDDNVDEDDWEDEQEDDSEGEVVDRSAPEQDPVPPLTVGGHASLLDISIVPHRRGAG